MTDPTNHPESDPAPEPQDIDLDGYAEEIDEPEAEGPRRAASAQFIVEGGVGAHAAMREAMDPAHASLTDALRLSYRVLQVVMVLLIVLFAFSGIATVKDTESGVKLHWGAIEADAGDEALASGLQMSWPYPVGEFIIFQVKGRRAALEETYWPGIQPGQSLESMIDNASTTSMIKPGRDGYVVTAGGDIAHLQLDAEFEIDQPVRFVHQIADADARRDADRLVQMALQRAVVHTAAQMSVQELVERKALAEASIKESAQEMLDDLESGIRLGNVRVEEPMAAMAIVNLYRQAQAARVEAQDIVAGSQEERQKILTSAAGENWPELIGLIEAYEDADEDGDEAAATEALASISTLMRSDRVTGEVAEIVGAAEGYLSSIELDLGSAAQRFDGLLPAYQEAPQLTITNLWMKSYASVLSASDTEKFYVPSASSDLMIRLQGLQEIQEARREARMRARENIAYRAGLTGQPYIKGAADVTGEAYRTLLNQGGQITGRRDN